MENYKGIIIVQNKIIQELRRIFGSQQIPQELSVHHHQDKDKIIENLSLLYTKLTEILVPNSMTSYDRQTSLEKAYDRFSIREGVSLADQPMSDYCDPIPLCIPNNYKWNALEHKLELLENAPRTGLHPCQEGLDLLRSISGPVCIVCVVGPARTGKSYLLGQLQGSRFRLGHTMRAETMGIWIGQKIIEHRTSDGEKVSIVFLDSEGIGSMDSTDSTEATDNQIFTLSTLLSSLLIYNSKSVPNNTDLEKLHFVSKLSDSIRIRSHAENTREDVQKFKKYAPDFFWLIRDVTLDIIGEDGKSTDIRTYMEQKILRTENGVTESVRRRNEIRDNIKSFFKTVNAFTLPVPSDRKEVLQKMDKPENNKYLNGEFLVKLDILKTIITEKYHSKRGMNNSLLTGCQLADMLESYSSALSSKGYVPDWQSAWELTVKMAYKRAGEKSFNSYKKSMIPLRLKLPCEQAVIVEKHDNCMKETIDIFRNDTLMDTNMESFQENLKQFTNKCATFDVNGQCTGGLLHTLLTENKDISMNLCTATIANLVKNDLEPVLSNINHQTSYDTIMSVIADIEREYWQTAVGPSAGDVFKTFYEGLLERKKQIANTISQLSDYHEKNERAKAEKIRVQMLFNETERQKQEIQRQKEAQAKQHLAQVNVMKETTDRQIQQLNEERTRAINQQRDTLGRQHSAEVSRLRQEQATAEGDRNRKLQEYQQAQANLNQQIANAQNEIQQLRNRPPVIVHHGGGGGGCCIQ